MRGSALSELTSLFFATRQLIRARLPAAKAADPNAWARFETLRFIGERREPTMREIAQYLRIKAPSATSLVDNLAREGLVARASASGDRRVVRVRLTPSGRGLVRSFRAASARAMRDVFSKLSDREMGALIGILRRLHRAHAGGLLGQERADAAPERIPAAGDDLGEA